MARKRRGPTLLELIRERPPGGAFRTGPMPGSSSAPSSNGDAPAPSYAPSRASGSGSAPRGSGGGGGGGLAWWQMGSRTLRIPVGYVIVAGGLALALAVVGYLIGYKRAEAGAEAERARAIQAQLDMVDPLNADPGRSAPAGADAAPTGSIRPPVVDQPAQNRQTRPQQRAQTPERPAVPTGDPRVVGMNYWVVARLGPDEARRAAAFLTANGVDVAVVETNSDRFREVIASTGFEGSGNSPEAARLKSRILELGRLYRVSERGPTDFSDMYARKHSGR